MPAPNDDPPEPTPDQGPPPPDVTIDAPPDPPSTSLGSTQAAEVRARSVEATQSAVGRAVAHDVRIDQGALGLARARSVVTNESAIGVVAAGHVETRGGISFLVLARRWTGDATVLLDWRSVLAVACALVVLARLLRGRR